MSENTKFIVVGWSPELEKSYFVASPSRFCQIHRFSADQCGIVTYLSRYHFEKNPWLLKQAILLLDLLLTFGEYRRPGYCQWRRRLGLPVYVAPRTRKNASSALNVSTYCALNGIGPQLLLPLQLVCDTPTAEGLGKARDLLQAMI